MTYTWNAADYARHSSGQEQWARELLSSLELKANDHVLDIGCGDGRITALIAARVPNGRVVGVDSSEDMIRHGSARFSTIPNLSFRQRDARELDFGGEFTVVFSNAALHWVREQEIVVEGIAKGLRPGGRLLAQCGGHGNGRHIIDSFMRVATLSRWREHFVGYRSSFGFYTPQQYERWLRAHGLEPDEVRLIPKDMVHAYRAVFEGWLRTAWHPYTAPVPSEVREQFIAEVCDEYLREYPPDANGCIHVEMTRLQVRARKSR